MKYLLFCALFLGGCSQGFQKEDGVYRYKAGGADITVSFANPEDATPECLGSLSGLTKLLLKDMPSGLKKDPVSVEGLTGDAFYNLFVLGDAFFLGGVEPYQNKMVVYAFLASVYDKYIQLEKRYSPVPLDDFAALVRKNPQGSAAKLNAYTIRYALDGIFFVSILEMFERPDRYFYPAKTKEELFRVLFYPELLGFWDYMAQRFGKAPLFVFAKQAYSPEGFRQAFAEETPDTEKAFVDDARGRSKDLVFNSVSFKDEYENLLKLYMTGTKKSLMKE